MKKYLLFFLIPFSSYSQILDTSFDTDGVLKYQLSDTPTSHKAYDADLEGDGKIIYIGYSGFTNTTGFIARYNADGTKDATYNQDGFKYYSHTPQTLFIQNDDRALVGGGNRIFRFLINGENDLSFNSTGSVKISLNDQNMVIRKISIQTDTKIIVSGHISNGTDNDFAVVRLNSDGTLDSTFGTNGILLINIGPANDHAYSHKILSDGKILVLGDTHNGTNYDIALTKINSNGTLDNSFGINGKVITSIGSTQDQGRDLAVLSDAKILTLGVSGGKFILVRYLSDGSLDNTLDSDGIFILNHNALTSVSTTPTINVSSPKLKVLSDDTILISGSSDSNHKIIKLLANGSTYDSSFDSDGVAIIDNQYDVSTFLIHKLDGKIIAGGYTTYPNGAYNIAQIDLNSNGSIISNTAKQTYLSYELSVKSIFEPIDQSNLILTAGISASNPLQYTYKVSKFLSNGALDTSYGTNGHVVLGQSYGYYAKMHRLTDGIIIVSHDNFVYKITPNGFLDTTFGVNGVLEVYDLGLNNSYVEYIDDSLISSDNKIVLAFDSNALTQSNDDSTYNFGIVKLNLDGTLDSSFGTNGLFTTRFNSDENYYEYPISMCQDTNNDIIVTGVSFLKTLSGSNSNICTLKLNLNGTLVNAFGTNGKSIIQDPVSNTPIWPIKLLNSQDGHFLLNFHRNATSFGQNDTQTTSTLKIDGTNGNLINSFGNSGIVNDITGSSNICMIIQPDGKILKAGNKNKHFSISRYNTDGSIDTGFGNNGEIGTIIDLQSNIHSMLLLPNGKLFVNGSSSNFDRKLSVIARYTDLNLGIIDFSTDKNELLVYPNPIENEATFEYTLTDDEKITIEIMDFQGKRIYTIISNEFQHSGLHKLNFNLENLPTGTYVLKISTAKGNQAIQILKK